jgi:integrase
VIELVNEFLLAKARAGRSDRYLRQLRVSLKNFAAGRSRIPIGEVTTGQIEKWIQGQEWAPKTARGYLSDVRTLYNFAQRRGHTGHNPAAGVELPTLDGGARIEVHTPEQVQAVLNWARAADLNICRHLAIRYFAGLRTAEAHRLREEDLKLEQNLLEVPAVKSKTRSRRLVTIQPNLKAWLELGGELLAVGDMKIRAIIRGSKIAWPHNVARHSFVSYHLAHFKKTNETALEAGHTEAMLFAHYRALVTPDQAAAFWAIRPKA